MDHDYRFLKLIAFVIYSYTSTDKTGLSTKQKYYFKLDSSGNPQYTSGSLISGADFKNRCTHVSFSIIRSEKSYYSGLRASKNPTGLSTTVFIKFDLKTLNGKPFIPLRNGSATELLRTSRATQR